MLPAQVNSAIQMDILPTQNIAILDQNPPQIYSILHNSNGPSPTKKPRQKKTPKLDETIPVMNNPHITRVPMGVPFDAPHHRSSIVPDTITSLVTTRLLNGHPFPFRFLIDHNLYDANNNINHNRILSPSVSLSSSSPIQTQQISTWPNEALQTVNTNLMSQLVTKQQIFGMNQLWNNSVNERTGPISSPRQNDYKHLDPNFMSTDQGSLLDPFHTLPLSSASASTSNARSAKPRRSKQQT